jgi:hypothetical protein
MKAEELHQIFEVLLEMWKGLKCGAGEGWRRSVGPIM